MSSASGKSDVQWKLILTDWGYYLALRSTQQISLTDSHSPDNIQLLQGKFVSLLGQFYQFF